MVSRGFRIFILSRPDRNKMLTADTLETLLRMLQLRKRLAINVRLIPLGVCYSQSRVLTLDSRLYIGLRAVLNLNHFF